MSNYCSLLSFSVYALVYICNNGPNFFCIFQRFESINVRGWYSNEVSNHVHLGRLLKSGLLHDVCRRKKFCCSSFLSSDAFDEVSPEGLWEVHIVNSVASLYFTFQDGVSLVPLCFTNLLLPNLRTLSPLSLIYHLRNWNWCIML